MKSAAFMSRLLMMGIVSSLLLTSCLLPGMIPLEGETTAPMPAMEKDGNALIEALKARDLVYLQALAEEQYT